MRKKWVVAVGIGLFVVAIVGLSLAALLSRKGAPLDPIAPGEFVATAPADLANRLGQRVRLTGQVKGADREPNGTPVLVLSWGTGSIVYCRFPKTDPLPVWFAVSEPGQTVTVRGTVAEMEPGFILLADCEHMGVVR